MAERRELKFNSLDEVQTEIERLAAGDVQVTGNHSFGKIVRHLAITNEMVCGKIAPPKLPWYMRMVMPLISGWILNGPVKPGFKLPSNMEPFLWPIQEVSVSEAVEQFRDSVEYYKRNGPLPIHPVFGKATREQVDLMTLKHAAMHLSFVIER